MDLYQIRLKIWSDFVQRYFNKMNEVLDNKNMQPWKSVSDVV